MSETTLSGKRIPKYEKSTVQGYSITHGSIKLLLRVFYWARHAVQVLGLHMIISEQKNVLVNVTSAILHQIIFQEIAYN